MRKQVETILQALLAASLAVSMMGCAATRPPQRIQDAIHTMNRHMPEYVIKANKAIGRAVVEEELFGEEVPFIQTIFNPLSQAKNLAGARLLSDIRQHPEDQTWSGPNSPCA